MTDRTFLHESEYRGPELMSAVSQFKVTICGAGAIGSNLAEHLARTGFRQLKIIDADRIEQHNIGNQVYDLVDVGGWKAEILRNRLFRVCEAEVDIETKRLESRNAKKFLSGCDLIVDAFDNAASRQVIQDFARKAEIPCLHVGLFEDYGEAIWDAGYRVPTDVDGDVCEYPLARNIILLAVSVASESILQFVGEGATKSFSITLRDLKIQEI